MSKNNLSPIVPRNSGEVNGLRKILGVLDAAVALDVSPHSFQFGKLDICFAGLSPAEIGEFTEAQRSKLDGLFE